MRLHECLHLSSNLKLSPMVVSPPEELGYRLWNNFLWRGYIHPDTSYKIPDTLGKVTRLDVVDWRTTKEDLYAQIGVARRKGLQDPGAMKKAKDKFKDDCFKTLTLGEFDAMLDRYKLDFDLFGYEEKREKYRAFFDVEKGGAE